MISNETNLDTICETAILTKVPDGCPLDYDSILCWPETSPGTVAIQPCFETLNGIKYDITQNASRRCLHNSTWEVYTDYGLCKEISSLEEPEMTTTIYFVGYSISLVALFAALCIFWKFKDLRCLRNTIHMNLMCTYILSNFMWIFVYTLQMTVQTNSTSCTLLILLLHYFHLTTFFWMLVEGLYLYILVVKTFTGKKLKLRIYSIVGWGIPFVFISVWAVVKYVTSPSYNGSQQASEAVKFCPWTSHAVDWIYEAPAIGVLIINALFLFNIMWVLITKLRSADNMETQQYRKATKALLVLIPLLGITYILVIIGPAEGISKRIYDNVRAVLLSTQGFTVALFYCFLNVEVKNTLRRHYSSWHTHRNLSSRRRRRSSSKDWSSQLRDSKRLYQNRSYHQKRGSTSSDATVTTVILFPFPRMSRQNLFNSSKEYS